VGNVGKAAVRIQDFVAGGYPAKGVASPQGGKREWVCPPLGSDSVAGMKTRTELLKEPKFNARNPIWSSTCMNREKLISFV
ncbi:hypothetical protein K488DRAFT_46104, partial [Vararia minispora EC-137]